MTRSRSLKLAFLCLLLGTFSACNRNQNVAIEAPQGGTQPVENASMPMDDDDIAGRVLSANGPEAGVWVIAETDELDTFFARSVVTDDDGRYLLPDLPEATYSVWVRGYGLADSAPISARPGSG